MTARERSDPTSSWIAMGESEARGSNDQSAKPGQWHDLSALCVFALWSDASF